MAKLILYSIAVAGVLFGLYIALYLGLYKGTVEAIQGIATVPLDVDMVIWRYMITIAKILGGIIVFAMSLGLGLLVHRP